MLHDMHTQILEDMKACMKSGDKIKLQTLRLMLSALKNKSIDIRQPLDEQQAHAVLITLKKQWQEAQKQWVQAGRTAQAEHEQVQLDLLAHYLPKSLNKEDIAAHVDRCINELDAKELSDMGAVMKQLRPQLTGQCDMGEVSQLVRSKLTSPPHE